MSDLDVKRLAIEGRAKARAEAAKWEKVLAALEEKVEGGVVPVRVFVGEVPESTMGKIQAVLQRNRRPMHIRDIFAQLLEMGVTTNAKKSRAIWNYNSDLTKKLGQGVFVKGKEPGTWGLVDYDAPIVNFSERRGRRGGKRK